MSPVSRSRRRRSLGRGNILERHELVLGQNLRILPKEARHNQSVLTDIQDAFAVHLEVESFELFGQTRLHATVVPEQVQSQASRRERKRNLSVQAAGYEKSL